MSDKKIELTTEQMSSVLSTLKKNFQEAGEVIEILKNATVIQESAESLIDDDKPPEPIVFRRITLDYESEEITIAKYTGEVVIEDKWGSHHLMKNGIIIQIENIAHYSKFKKHTIRSLKKRYKVKNESAWNKEKGLGWLIDKGWKELHWCEHYELAPKLEPETDKAKNVGVVDLKIKWEDGRLELNKTLLDYILTKKEIFMEKYELPDGQILSTQKAKPPEGWVLLTKENFFEQHKPITGIFMEKRGDPVTSTRVLEILNKGKQFMEQKDIDGFYHLMEDSPEIEALTDDEFSLLDNTVITEEGLTVLLLLESLEDLMDD